MMTDIPNVIEWKKSETSKDITYKLTLLLSDCARRGSDDVILYKKIMSFYDENANDFSKIQNFKDILSIIYDKNYTISFRILISLYEYSLHLSSLREFYDHLVSSSSLTKKLLSQYGNNFSSKSQEIITAIKQYILPIIKAFMDSSFLLTAVSLQDADNFPRSMNIEEMIIINSEEMVNRLEQLVKLIGVRILKFIGIEILSASQFYDLSYADKVNYFSLCCRCINCKFNEIIVDYHGYVDLIDVISRLSIFATNKTNNNLKKDIIEECGVFLREYNFYTDNADSDEFDAIEFYNNFDPDIDQDLEFGINSTLFNHSENSQFNIVISGSRHGENEDENENNYINFEESKNQITI